MADPLRDRSETYRIMSRGESPEEAIRRLVQTASEIEEPRPVSMWEWAASNPGILSSRPKSPERRLADTRKQFVMDELLHKYPKPTAERPGSWGGIPAAVQRDMAMYANDAADGLRGNPVDHLTGVRGRRTDIQSPYEATGALGAGSGLSNFMTWAQAIPAAVYAGSEMLGNQVGAGVSRAFGGDGGPTRYPEAGRDLTRAVNTFSQPLLGGTGDSAWTQRAAVRKAADQMAFDATRPESYGGLSDSTDRVARQIETAVGQPKTGEEFLASHGVHPTAARWWGMVNDATMDPFTGHIPAVRMARAGNPAGAMRVLRMDYGVPAALTGAISAGEAAMDEGDNVVSWDANGDPYLVPREERVLRRLQGR